MRRHVGSYGPRVRAGSVCLALVSHVTVIALVTDARAEAVLQSQSSYAPTDLFPEQISIFADVAAQVESTTVVLKFPALVSGGDYVLTVPSPKGAYSVGVDLDRGDGFVPLPIQAQAPPPGAGSGPQASQALKDWRGDTPLLATLSGLQPGPLTVRVRFLRLLRRFQGRVQLDVGADRCPMRDPADPGATVAISVRLRTSRAFQSLYTKGAPAKVQKQSSTEAQITVTPTPATGSVRTTIFYEEQGSGIHAQVLAHRTPTADPLGGTSGYFLLLLDADNVAVESTQPRTLNLVVDRSGSMQGSKIAQARLAALAMLENLHPDDKLNIHIFNEVVTSWVNAPVHADEANLGSAASFINNLTAVGSTDLEAAIVAGLQGETCSAGGGPDLRYDAMILLSDGLPTSGMIDSAAIHQSSIAHNCMETRIFTFAVGQDADVPLLEAISRTARGRNFVLNDAQAASSLADAVRELFEDIYAVRVTDLELSISKIDPHETLPERPPDLFNGGQVIVVGRYRTPGTGTIAITGDANGQPFAKSLTFAAPALEQDNAFIKYVWATEKVGNLLAQMGRGGDREQLEREITALGLGYSIQTPFTSFATPPPSGSGSSGSGSSGGSGGSNTGGGGYPGIEGGGSGDVDLVFLAALLCLLPFGARRRWRRE